MNRVPGGWKTVGFALIVVIGALWWRSGASVQEVEAVRLETRDVRSTVVVAGRVRAPSTASVGTTVPGVVRAVEVEEGDAVVAGAVLVRLDDREFRAAAAEAEARLAEVQASTADARRRAELELELAERELARVRAVIDAGGLTAQRLDQAEQRVAEGMSRVTALDAGGDGMPAAVRTARAALDVARARLAATVVVAPFAGVVLERRIEPGDAVQAGAPLLVVAEAGAAEVEVFPAEEHLARIRAGAPALISADAFPDQVYPARVARVAPSVDAALGTVAVRLSVEAPEGILRPGMTVSANLETGRTEGASVLPASAVRGFSTADPWVAVIRDGRIERSAVQVGLRAGTYVEIVGGLDPTTAVARVADDVEPGTRVRVRSGA